MTSPIVLVHGGGFAASCWDRLVPLLPEPVFAVDLPGRGTRPAPLADLGIADFVAAVVQTIESADLREVTLVGHSLAGVTLPGVAAAVPDRLARLIFVACTVPAAGQRVVDTLADPGVRALAEEAAHGLPPDTPLDAGLATALFCNDMDEATTAYTLELMVPEAPRPVIEPVALAGLDQPVPRNWIRPVHDAVVPPDVQARFATAIDADIVDIDAAHMAMISAPRLLADAIGALLDR